jgi:transcriptional regulator with XRE-family HTH domain
MAQLVAGLGGKLRAAREAAGMTQQGLATTACLAISVVTQLEQGLKVDPRLSTTLALARALGVTVDELVADEAPKAKLAARTRRRRRHVQR